MKSLQETVSNAQRMAAMEMKEQDQSRKDRRGRKRDFDDNDNEETYATGGGRIKKFKAGGNRGKKRHGRT